LKQLKFHVTCIKTLVRELDLSTVRIFGVLLPYYFLTLISALFEGLGMMLLVGIFTNSFEQGEQSYLPAFIQSTLQSMMGDVQLMGLIHVLIAVYGINLVVRFSLNYCNGVISARLRRLLQETCFNRHLLGDWSHMRDFRVGDAVGTITQEATVSTKYLTSVVASVYFFLGATVMAALALLTSFQVTFVLGLIALPLIILIQKVFVIQARFSKQSAILRNDFSSDITDRLNGLLQVHVDDNFDYHFNQGIRNQRALTDLEIKTGICQAAISSFNLLVPLCALLGLAAWLLWFGVANIPDMALVASIAILGMKFIGQLNGAVASLGNLSRLSGSLHPVIKALSIPCCRNRIPIKESVAEVQLKEGVYAYGENQVIDNVSLIAKRGMPLVLSGRSGKGKTTIANLLAGLYFPLSGAVAYIDVSGNCYDSTDFRARVGFVMQDIYLFQGSMRTNLTSGRDCTDQEIWSVLEQVDATDFVRDLGGLDAESAEAGRSLSGGQRRRLGVARVLLSGADILIFDEVTAGLDTLNKAAVLNVIERLSVNYVVVVVSHETLELPAQTKFCV
jgi:ABC-type transport system involved in cytochrome bd biosynthesis fused ATPase/permease subunit